MGGKRLAVSRDFLESAIAAIKDTGSVGKAERQLGIARGALKYRFRSRLQDSDPLLQEFNVLITQSHPGPRIGAKYKPRNG